MKQKGVIKHPKESSSIIELRDELKFSEDICRFWKQEQHKTVKKKGIKKQVKKDKAQNPHKNKKNKCKEYPFLEKQSKMTQQEKKLNSS